MTAIIDPCDYLAEADVEGRWPVLKAGEIRRARKAGTIEFFAFATGPRYTPSAIQNYIDRKYRREPTAWSGSPSQQSLSPPEMPRQSDGHSAAITSLSHIPSVAESITPAGMSPELAQSAAEACAQRLAKMRSKPSSRSAPQPRRARRTSVLTLVQS